MSIYKRFLLLEGMYRISDTTGRLVENEPKLNIVKDYNMLQGFSDVSENAYTIQRDINTRCISVENSSPMSKVGIAIVNVLTHDLPPVMKVIEPRDTLYLAINPPECTPQYLWILHPVTGKQLGTPIILETNSNQFVLREGLNNWFVQRYKRAVFRSGRK